MRYNLHPLRNLPVESDPGVLTSNGMSVTGEAVVSLATRENLCPDPHCTNAANWTSSGQGTPVAITGDGDEADTCIEVSRSGGSNIRLVGSSSAGQAAVVPGQSCGFIGSIKPVSLSAGSWTSARLLVRWFDSTPSTLSEVEIVTSSAVQGEWIRLAGSAVAPVGAAFAAVQLACGYSSGSDAVIRVGRTHVEPRRLAISPEDFLPDNDPRPVNAWNPITGQFDPSLQAVRVYRDPGMSHPAAHRVVVAATPGEPLHALTHMWADDPGSVGKTAGIGWNWVRSNDTYISSAGSSLTLGADPVPLIAGGVAPAEAAKAQIFLGLGASGSETNLLYSASQVSPHPIERYNDERSHGHELVDPDAYWKGSRSLEAPIEYDASARLYIPETRLRLNNGIN
jgi:hypothetical protein